MSKAVGEFVAIIIGLLFKSFMVWGLLDVIARETGFNTSITYYASIALVVLIQVLQGKHSFEVKFRD